MPKQQQKTPLTAGLLALTIISSPAIADDMTKAIEDELKFGNGGAVKFDLNYRYENVNQDNVTNPQLNGKPAKIQPVTANANTARLRLGLLSPVFHGLQGFAEYQGTYAMQSDYNSTRNDKNQYSIIPDPYVNELDQLWLSYSGIPDTVVKGGRQRIKFDDDRFIGNVGWRQLEQTYDSALITNKSIKNLTINAGYMGRVKTFTATTEGMTAPIVNANYNFGDYGNLIGYGYWLDFTDPDVYFKSSQSYGLRFINSEKPRKFLEHYSFIYTAEWSIQADYQNSPKDYTVNRYNLMGGFTAYMFSFQGAMEQLDGVGKNQTFITPLGTNHAFQGWADIFVVTPDNGVRDVFGTVTAKLDNDSIILSGIYHNFYDDTGNMHYGKEWDFSALKKFGQHYSLLARYAYYDADQYNTDTQKIWLQGNVSF